MEIQNVTSTVDKQFHNKTDEKTSSVSFKDAISNTSDEQIPSEEQNFDFQEINGMSIGEIESFYQDKRQAQLLQTLKYATLFSTDMSMNEAMFNTVLSQGNLEESQSFLSSMFSNRNSYLGNESDHGAGIRKSIIDQLNGDVKAEQIELEKEFQYTMIQFDVAQHMSDMMNFSKNERDKNKDNGNLSFLYNNMYLQYQSLFDEYEGIENNNSNLIKQQLASSRINLLNF